MQRLITVLVAFCGFAALAEDYTLPAGKTDTLSVEATYGTMTIGGDFSAYVPGGTKSSNKTSIGVTNFYATDGSLTIDSNGGGQYFMFGSGAKNTGTQAYVGEANGQYGIIKVKYTKNSTGEMAGRILGDGCVMVRGVGLVVVIR